MAGGVPASGVLAGVMVGENEADGDGSGAGRGCEKVVGRRPI